MAIQEGRFSDDYHAELGPTKGHGVPNASNKMKNEKTPNQAPEPTTTAVTECAPSRTKRASCGRGSS